MSTAVPSQATPTNQRHTIIDALRGFAMFGIMVVNFPSINTLAGDETSEYGFIVTKFDQVMAAFSMYFLNGKFYPVFAFLFGFGMYIFMRNAAGKGLNPRPLAWRRMIGLLMIGLLHILFVWWGDILTVYALLGLFLAFFYGAKERIIISTAFALALGVPLLQFVLHAFSIDLSQPVNAMLWPYDRDLEAMRLIYADGSFLQAVAQRLQDYIYVYTPLLKDSLSLELIVSYVAYYTQLFSSFLFGFWVAHARPLARLLGERTWLMRIWAGLLVAEALILAALFLSDEAVSEILGLLQGQCVAGIYITSFLLLCLRFPQGFWARAFVPIGQLSMTAYLLHTISFTFILYNHGLGLYGAIGPGWLICLALAFYVLVASLAPLWLARFSFGPFEWLWRSMTYGLWQPLRKTYANLDLHGNR